MQKIRRWSLAVQGLLLIMILVEVGSYLWVVIGQLQSSGERGEFVLLLGDLRMSMLLHFSGAWQQLSEGLIQNGLNPLYWLSSAEAVFSLCLYLLLLKLFAQFKDVKIFTPQVVSSLKHLAFLCFFWCGWMVFYPALLTISLKLTGLAEFSSFAITLGSKELAYLLLGTLLYASASIMAQALMLQQEQELVI